MDKSSVEYIAEIAWHSENGVLFFETDKNNNVLFSWIGVYNFKQTLCTLCERQTYVFDVDAKVNIANALA